MTPDLLVVANPVWEVSWLLDRLPVDRFTPDGRIPHLEDGGGSALNTACALALAGWHVLAAGRAGDDREGEACVAALRRRGVETRIELVPGRTTKRNHLYVERPSHATAFETTLPLKSAEPWEDAPPALEKSRLLLLDRLAVASLSWLSARRLRPGLLNGLNRNTPGMHGLDDPRLCEALPCLDYLQLPEVPEPTSPEDIRALPVEKELSPEVHAGHPLDPRRIHRPRPFAPLSARQADSLMDAGVQILARTRGAGGAILQEKGGEPIAVAAVPTEVVDPTGAGDAFAAGLLDGLLRGLALADAGLQAADWASRACRHLGARAWLDHEPPGASGGSR
jgi:sugar/nucleoside kinase (ribokinase family)